jgi:hypothetical protein
MNIPETLVVRLKLGRSDRVLLMNIESSINHLIEMLHGSQIAGRQAIEAALATGLVDREVAPSAPKTPADIAARMRGDGALAKLARLSSAISRTEALRQEADAGRVGLGPQQAADAAGPDADPPARRDWPDIGAGVMAAEGQTSDVAAAPSATPLADASATAPSEQRAAAEAVIAEMLAEPAWTEVTRCLIAPLVRHGLEVSGDPATVLRARARQFCGQGKRKLEFAARWLTREGSRHREFPRDDEIYAALGRYTPPTRTGTLEFGEANGEVRA